jgi:thiol-disulfide isomerase/thioredoxin
VSAALALWLGLAVARADSAGAEQARAEVALLEQRPGDALLHAQRAIALAPEDLASWEVHFQACRAGGLLDVCAAAARDLSPVAELARRAALVEAGLLRPDAIPGPGADPAGATLVLAQAALASGALEVALSLVADRSDPEAVGLRLRALLASGRERDAAAVGAALLASDPLRPDRLLPVLERADTRGPLVKLRAEALAVVQRQASSGLDPVGVYAAWKVGRALGDADLQAKARARLITIGEPAPAEYSVATAASRAQTVRSLKAQRNPAVPPAPHADRVDMALRLALALQELGRVEEAVAVLRDARATDDDVELAVAESRQLLRMGRTGEAITAAEAAARLASRPNTGDLTLSAAASRDRLAEAHFLRAVGLDRLGKQPDALVAARTAATLAPTGPRLVLVGSLHKGLGDREAAFAAFAAAAALGEPGLDSTLAHTWVGGSGWQEAADAASRAWLDAAGVETPERPSMPSRPSVGRPAPDLGPLLMSVAPEATAGETPAIILAFWASWCAPCVEELPQLARLGRELAAEGAPVVVLAVSLDHDALAVDRFTAERDLSGLVVTRGPALASEWRIEGVPHTFLVDREGILRWQHSGYAPEAIDQLGATVRTLTAR